MRCHPSRIAVASRLSRTGTSGTTRRSPARKSVGGTRPLGSSQNERSDHVNYERRIFRYRARLSLMAVTEGAPISGHPIHDSFKPLNQRCVVSPEQSPLPC